MMTVFIRKLVSKPNSEVIKFQLRANDGFLVAMMEMLKAHVSVFHDRTTRCFTFMTHSDT